MKFKILVSLLAASLCAVGLVAQTSEKKEGDKKSPGKSRSVTITRHGEEVAKEKVTYLGVETGPVPRALAAHLGLARDHGLVVNAVAENSPASGVLQENDLLKKFEDQLLIDSRQLSVLVRDRKPGDEVKLTIVRAGKEQVVTAKLGERELPRVFGLTLPDDGDVPALRFFQGEGGPHIERLRELPGLARDELNDVLRIIGRDRDNWFAGPRVHVFNRKLKDGSTILNMAEGNFAFSDDDGSIEIKAEKGDRQLTVKDAAGKVLFQGPINNDEQREQLPAEVKERLKKLDTLTIDFEADETLEQEGAAVKPPVKTKTSRPLPPGARPVRGSAPF
jgi:serine protease Do